MTRTVGAIVLVLAWTPLVLAQATAPALYIAPTEDGFEVYLAAAMTKKKVPASVTTNPDLATFTLKATGIEFEQLNTTGRKVVDCLFSNCAQDASTSVQLMDAAGTVVWSYSVSKGRGAKNKQSLAEAIAKHLKDDYLQKRPR